MTKTKRTSIARLAALTALSLGVLAGCSGQALGRRISNTSFRVGGTVSGLVTSGTLVLRTQRGDTATVRSNGKFVFAAPFPDGTAYAVIVDTQPAGQICEVFNAAGTVAGADVNSLVVTCSAEGDGTFTVGGTVTGLTIGTSFVLQNNGADDKSIVLTNTIGTFTFATSLADGAAYNVTALTQPLGQTCTVTNGTGTISGEDVTNILVVCSNVGYPTYLVGGTLSGLAVGGAVALENNGGNELFLFDNGQFFFTAARTQGSPYSVTVLVQPSGQACTVDNGSGTLGTSNVTNITVTCSNASSFTVGGNVTGLGAGRTLVLRKNGGNSTPITVDGAFTFSAAQADGEAYVISVRSQPAGQLCTLSNGTGAISGTNVTNIGVSCANVADASGGLDPSFGGGGGFTLHDSAGGGFGTDIGQSVTVDGSGRIVVAGLTIDSCGTFSMGLWRYTAAGALDTTFNGSGFLSHSGAGSCGAAQTVGAWVGIDGSSRIVVVGWSNDPSGTSWGTAVWRYNDDGTPDTSFNGSGFVRDTGLSGFNNGVSGAVDGSGRIVVAGLAWNGSSLDLGVWRFNDDGSADTTFNGTGSATHNGAAGGDGEDVGASMVLDGDGKIVITGYSTKTAGDQDIVVWRYLPNGTLDTSFNGTGIVTHNNAAGGGGNDVGNAITIDGSDRILVTGWSPSAAGRDDMTIWRFTPSGTLDTSFNGTGYALHNGAGGTSEREEGRAIRVDASGRIVVAGVATTLSGDTDMVVWRFTGAGALDTSFGTNGFATHDGPSSQDEEGRALVIDGSGRLIITGFSENAFGSKDMAIWKIFP